LEKTSIIFFTQKVRRMVKIDTGEIREKALERLEKLAEEAHSYAMDKTMDEKERRDWARIVGYMYQTLNSVASEYDVEKIKQRLEELRRFVESRAGERAKQA